MNFVFVTYRALNAIAPDDALLAEALRQRGHTVEGVVWDDPAADWSQYDAIVIRSCWDYAYTPNRFVAWLDHLDAPNLRVFNPIPIIRWNHDKRYLHDLQQHGIQIAPTHWCERDMQPNIHAILEQYGWHKAVIKPTISGTSMLTWTVERTDRDTHDAQLAGLLTQRDMMIQEFMPEILEGEWSIVFFGGQFSHAAVKRPKPGDFRVQDEHGGSWSQEQPSPELIAQAKHVLDCVKEDLLYARVDGVLRGGRFILMELELIEPMLYIGQNRAAADLFANELLKRLH